MASKQLFGKLKSDMTRKGWSPKSIVALVIFGAIILTFILVGYSGKHNAIGTGAAAQVNSTLIPVSDLKSESARLEQMYAPMFGGAIQGDAQRQFLRQQAMENLISTELMAQGSYKAGIAVSDQEIRDVITKEIPAFQDQGKFQRDRYIGILKANGWTPGEFETRVRNERATNRMRRALEEVAAPLQLEIQKLQALREIKRDVNFVKIDRDTVMTKMPVSNDEIQKRLQDKDFSAKVQVEFDKTKAQYGSEETVHAQHILIKAKAGIADSEKAALTKIEQIKKRAEKEDFGQLAAAVSEDEGSKATKGDLGTFGKAKMVPEFETAAFSQKVGVVGEPVKTPFGYHLIKVLDHKPAVEAKFEAVKNEVARKVLANEHYDERIKSLEAAMAAGQAVEVDAAIKAMGLAWDDTGFFEMGADTIPKMNSAVATAAAFEVSEKAPLAKKLARDGGALYVVKWKADRKEASPANGKWVDSVTRERSGDLLSSWLDMQKKSATIERNTSLVSGPQ